MKVSSPSRCSVRCRLKSPAAIVSRQANQRKRHQGRYNSKYALSERLVCGDCGAPYKRVTWNIHGRKQIVWRCVNRLEYGTKFCSHSPSIPEEELHQAILKAVQNLAANFTDEVARTT
ncbi:MAG: zinc ribbon domain-containing protein [Subdoligranulum sp.]